MESLLETIPRPPGVPDARGTGRAEVGRAPLAGKEKTKVNTRRDQEIGEEPLWKKMDSAHGTTYYVDQKAYARLV